MALVEGLNQIFVNVKFFIERISQKYGFSNKTMNFTTGQKISEI